ncbi:MAG: DMT family transporter [Promethearchaeota archaeon]
MIAIGLFTALLAAFSWAVSAAFYKTGAKDVSALTSNLIRLLLPLLILSIVTLILNLYPFITLLTFWEILFILGSSLFAFVIGDALYFVTIQNIGVSRGVPVTSIYPFFILLLQILFLSQPIHILMIPAVIITIAGVAILGRQLNPDSKNQVTLTRRQLSIGLIAGILTALSWSISTLLLDTVLDTTNLFLIAVIRLAFALTILTPIVLGQQIVWKRDKLTQRKLLYLSIGGVFALVIGYIAFALSLQLVDITSATVLSSLTPLFALIIGWRTLKERVTWMTVVGVMACVIGIIFIAIAVSLV